MIKILEYGQVDPSEVFARVTPKTDVAAIVTDIIENVKANGDKALFEYCEKFDKVTLSSLEVSKEEIDEAVKQVPSEFLEILKKAAANIRKFHEKQVRNTTALK